MNRLCMGFSSLLLFLSIDGPASASPSNHPDSKPKGVVIENVKEGYAAHQAGLLPGDVLLRWKRSASLPSTRGEASGELASPFDLFDLEIEQAPRGELTIFGWRNGEPLEKLMPYGSWKLETRIRLTDSQAEQYEEAKLLISREQTEDGLARLNEMASDFARGEESAAASWLFLQMGLLAGEQRLWDTAETAFERARLQARAGEENSLLPRVLETAATFWRDANQLERASAAYLSALEERQLRRSESLSIAATLHNLGAVAWLRGDLEEAESHFKRALGIRGKLAAQSLDTSKTLNNLGGVSWYRGDLVSADAYHRRSLSIKEKLAPDGLGVALSLNNLGLVATDRGDLAAAENFYRRSLTLQKAIAPRGLGASLSLHNLGNVAWFRRDLAAAKEFYLQSLAIKEQEAPQSADLAASLNNLGQVAFEHQDFVAAEEYLHRALDIYRRIAPRGIGGADTSRILGDIALARSDLEVAEARYTESLAIRRVRVPGSAAEAQSCQRLAILNRQRNRLDQALSFYDCAIEALETQRSKLGGSDESRSGFASRYAGVYQEAIDLLVEVGKTEQAFHLLERYRAREFLKLLAERDLLFSSDLPADLEKQRRIVDRGYDQAFGTWLRLTDETDEAAHRKALKQLEMMRRRQDEVRAEIEAASPRLATLKAPQPLDLRATRTALDPGTLLLSYSIGDKTSHLFAIGPQKGDLRVFTLAVGGDSLREQIKTFREALNQGRFDRRPEKALLGARQLSQWLLSPAAAQIATAERLLVLADGPLHSLPFAALTDPGAVDGRRFLVETKAIHLAASATVFALLKQQRREHRETLLTAFGDPEYPVKPPRLGEVEPQVRTALRSGFGFTPLPATRVEIEELVRLYPRASQTFLGPEATEARAKAVDQETTHLHIATHGLLNDRFPLESSLAFSLPSSPQKARENGLLQAWEVFEQVRIDADLVTLSACDTGHGKVFGGEGLMGLTRAFQYAGARSVVASLWSVSDESTGELMKRFYGYIKQGQTKDEALRSAQLDLLRNSPFTHPFHWAGFQPYGDWR